MFPRASAGEDVATSRIPVYFRDTVVVGRVHQLQICSEIFVCLTLFTLKVHVPEIEVKALL